MDQSGMDNFSFFNRGCHHVHSEQSALASVCAVVNLADVSVANCKL